VLLATAARLNEANANGGLGASAQLSACEDALPLARLRVASSCRVSTPIFSTAAQWSGDGPATVQADRGHRPNAAQYRAGNGNR
jgi:hypothetical protein